MGNDSTLVVLASDKAVCGAQSAASAYARARWRAELLRATPSEVWKEYAEDGISLLDAVKMEESYVG